MDLVLLMLAKVNESSTVRQAGAMVMVTTICGNRGSVLARMVGEPEPTPFQSLNFLETSVI